MTADHRDPSASSRGNGAGIVVVVLAVVIGLIVLTKGYGSARSEVGPPTTSKATTTVIESTTTTIAGNPPAEVKVKAVNATSTQGLATKTRDMLQARGYTQVAVGDAPTPQLSSEVFYTAGAQADAQNVARALGLNLDVVKPMPEPPPVSPGDATVLVMAGVDLT
jgi:hypothetical protein